MGAGKLIAIILVSLFVFTGAILFLLWFFRDRFVPKIPESSRDPEGEDPEESGYAMADTGYADPYRSSGRPVRPAAATAGAGSLTPAFSADTEDGDYEDDDDYEDGGELYDGPEDEAEEAEETAEPAAEADGSEPGTAHLQDILDCTYLPGRRLSECGIPKSLVSADGSEVPMDGDLFGSYVYGGLTLSGDDPEDPAVESFYIIAEGMDYSDCREQFAARFGEPVSEGEQEGEDGSKTVFAGFTTDYGTLWLSRGDGNDYLNINFT